MSNLTLKEIYFGRADGLQESEDSTFSDLFYKENLKYEQLENDITKFIISGRKGTGKTILAKYFEKEVKEKGILSKGLTATDIKLRSFQEKESAGISNKEMQLFIEYTILCEYANLLLENKQKLFSLVHIFEFPKILRKIKYLKRVVFERHESENFFKQTFNESRQMNRTSNISGKIAQMSAEVSPSLGYSSTDQVDSNYSRTPYYNLINELKKSLLYLMKKVPLNLIYDDLDEFDERIGDSSVKFFISFISVANNINMELRRNQIKSSRVIILMRSDILNVLNNHAPNLNKILADAEIRLNWIKKKVNNNEMHPLMDLIVTKIKKSNSQLSSFTKDEVYRMFFPVTIEGRPVIDRLLNWSFGRPRDIINMLNIIKVEYPQNTSFGSQSFKDTELEYSTKFLNELRNEMSTHYSPATIDECFYIVKQINKKYFWASDVRRVINNGGTRITHLKEVEMFIDCAYRFGIIGNSWQTGSRGSSSALRFSFKYREDGSDFPNLSQRFSVHFALRKNLLN